MTETTDIMAEQGPIAGEGPLNENGWQRESVWAGTQNAGDSLAEYCAYYKKGNQRGEITYFVEEITLPEENGVPEHVEYTVEEQMHWYTVHPSLGGDYEESDEDDQYEYDHASVYFYPTVEDAARKAREMGLLDEAWCFNT